MNRTHAARMFLVVVLVSTVLGSVACTSSTPPQDVGQGLSSALRDRGIEPTDPICDRTGAVQVGDVTRCTVDVDGQPLDITARVTDVDGDGPTMEVQSAGRPLARTELARRLSEDVERPVTCDGDLAPQPGATATCTASDGSGGTVSLTVTTTDVTPDGVIQYLYQ